MSNNEFKVNDKVWVKVGPLIECSKCSDSFYYGKHYEQGVIDHVSDLDNHCNVLMEGNSTTSIRVNMNHVCKEHPEIPRAPLLCKACIFEKALDLACKDMARKDKEVSLAYCETPWTAEQVKGYYLKEAKK